MFYSLRHARFLNITKGKLGAWGRGRERPLYLKFPHSFSAKLSPEERPYEQRKNQDPEQDDNESGGAIDRSLGPALRFGLELDHQLAGDEANCESDSGRNDDDVVEIAKHGDEIGNQIDWTEGVGGDRAGHDLGIPRDPWIARRYPHRKHIAPNRLGPLFRCLEHGTMLTKAISARVGCETAESTDRSLRS